MKFLKDKQNIYIAPYSPMTLKLEEFLYSKYKIKHKGFIDNSVIGNNIYRPSDIPSLEIDCILILSPKWDLEIYRNLLQYVKKDVILVKLRTSGLIFKKSFTEYYILKLIDSLVQKIIIKVLTFFNFKVSILWAERIGELCLESEGLLRRIKLKKKLRKNKYLILTNSNKKSISNLTLFKLYKKEFSKNKYTYLIQSELLLKYMRHLIKNNDFYRKIYFSIEQRSNDYEYFINMKPFLEFNKKQINDGKKILKSLSINYPFVCIFSRDSAYVESVFNKFDVHSHNTFRDSDIDTYNKAIKYLLKKGYCVVRIGSIAKKKISFNHPNVIDYSFSKYQSDFMDIFLISQCEFTIGNHSGILDVSNAFGKTRLGVNIIPIDAPVYSTKNDLYIPKKLKRNEKYLSLNKYFDIMNKSNLCHFKSKTYRDLNMQIEDNTDDEILSLVKEYIDPKKDTNTDKVNIKKYFKVHNKSKQFNTVKTTISKAFLKYNPWYIED